jgi:hypothetical protein
MSLETFVTYSCDAPGCPSRIKINGDADFNKLPRGWLVMTFSPNTSGSILSGTIQTDSSGTYRYLIACCPAHLCAAFMCGLDVDLTKYLMEYRSPEDTKLEG